MKKDKSWVQLARYFAGELTQEESKKMKSWIKADTDRAKEVERLYDVWKHSGKKPYELDLDKAWMRLTGDMDEIDKLQLEAKSSVRTLKLDVQQYSKKGNRPGNILRWVTMIAATVLIVAMAGFFTFYSQIQIDVTESTSIENQVFITKNGERANYILSDGSKVMLHAGSRLEIPENFNTKSRKLYLEGEAYFEVTEDEDIPFIVESQLAYTRVLGTRFLVKAWPEADSQVEVIVSEGKVAFGNSQKGILNTTNEVFLTRNEIGLITKDQQPVVSKASNLNWYMGWTEGRLEFENRQLQEVLPRLERWYNIEIIVDDSQLGRKKITAVIDYSQPMSEVLKGIALTHGLEVSNEGRIYRFSSSE